MSLDLSTLFVVTTLTSAVAGCLLLLSWLQNRDIAALAYWGSGFLIASLASALITHEAVVGEFLSVTVGHACLALAYGVIWKGVRKFNNRPTYLWATLAGAAAWILATQFDAFYQSPHARTALMAAIVVSYSLLAAADFWHARHEGLMSRWPVIVLLIMHAVIFLTRIPVAGWLRPTADLSALQIDWITILVLETILHAFCVAYLFGSMARERIVVWYKQASLTDALTGVANRRAFMLQAEKHLNRARFDGTPTAIFAVDLDGFKEINDSFGHAVGDDVLIAFCRAVTTMLRPADLFGRIGGEEFACLLPNTTVDNALAVAERLRTAHADMTFGAAGRAFQSTVSIGLTVADAGSLSSILARADRALYRAKSNGRNRVEIEHPGRLSLPQAPSIAPATGEPEAEAHGRNVPASHG